MGTEQPELVERKAMSTSTPLYADSGKVVAFLKNGIIRKNVSEEKHLVRYPTALSGWAFDRSIIQRGAELGATDIHVWARDTEIMYKVSFREFFTKAVPLNRKWGIQVLLPLRYWTQEGEGITNEEPDIQAVMF